MNDEQLSNTLFACWRSAHRAVCHHDHLYLWRHIQSKLDGIAHILIQLDLYQEAKDDIELLGSIVDYHLYKRTV